MDDRVKQAFTQVVAQASDVFPWIASAKVRCCRLADSEHRKKWRQFAHSNHYPMTVCFARDAEKQMTYGELLGMSAHELGHLVALELKLPAHMKESKMPDAGRTPKAVQNEADMVAREILKIPLRYNRRTLQELHF